MLEVGNTELESNNSTLSRKKIYNDKGDRIEEAACRINIDDSDLNII